MNWEDLVSASSSLEEEKAKRLMQNARRVEIYTEHGKTLIVAHFWGCQKGDYFNLPPEEAERLAPRDKHGTSKAIVFYHA